MKLLKKIYVGALILFSSTALAGAMDNKIVDQVFAPSVQLDKNCSGEIIHSKRNEKTGKVSTIVLTAKHCVLGLADNKTVDINKNLYDKNNRLIGVKTYTSYVLGKSYKSDLAVLKLRDEDTFFEKVAQVAPKDMPLEFAQDVHLVGYPLGRSMTYTVGKLGYVEDDMFTDVSTTGQFYRATPDLAPGSSGSSMFAQDAKGDYKVVGVATGGARAFSFMNFFTPIEEINEYLDVVSKTFDKESE